MTVSTAASQKPRLMGARALRSLARALTTRTPMTEAKIPMAGTMSGKRTAGVGLMPLMRAEGGVAQDQRGDDGDLVGLEEVGRHAGAVAHVVAHVVGDGGGVAGVVLGDAGLDLAHQVGADVGRLGEDAAADSHEQGEQRGAEGEADQDGGGRVLEDQHDGGGAEQAQADAEHAGHGAGAEGDPQGAGHAAALGRRRPRCARCPARRCSCR